MKKATRKIYLSIIFVTLSLLTMVATTFAWVGIVSNASFERISINLETDNEKSLYGIQLSLTGEEGTFHDSIDPIDLQKQILINIGVPISKLNSEASIRTIFNSLGLSQCTTTKYSNTALNNFTTREANEKPYSTIGGEKTNYLGYFPFDIWLAVYQINDGSNDGQNVNTKLEVFLRESGDGGILSSGVSSAYIPNEIVYPTSSQALSSSNIFLGKTVSGTVTIRPSNAARISIQKADAVDLYHPEQYVNAYNNLVIYTSGGNEPSYNDNVYDFGGVLPNDVNFARLQYNSIHSSDDQLGDVPTAVINRGDIKFVDDGDINKIIKPDEMTTTQMIKLHFNFWFEGWDSDCFEAIDGQNVSVNLNFSTKKVGEQ